ncbi:hypothetical protein BVY04_04100 [bacterium M21]|nr:hypothetical protein BVY04_04100 [bacterium M21]
MDRKTFIKMGTTVSLAPFLPAIAQTKRPEKVRIGLIGCGQRGSIHAAGLLKSDPSTELVAVADLFADQVNVGLDRIQRKAKSRLDRANVKSFSGWDAAEHLVREDLDLVILTATPVFRPQHLELAIKAGRHVLAEKPVCVDAVGLRKIAQLSKLAEEKGLTIFAGTQCRYHSGLNEGIKRVHDGQIGDLVAAECHYHFNSFVGANLKMPRTADPTEMEYQVRNWKCFIWGSGDHIVEQHVHCLDAMNWAFNRPPQTVTGIGGRSVDLPMPKYGNRYSHFGNHYDYGDGVLGSSLCRQGEGTALGAGGRIIGTKGKLDFGILGGTIITGERPWQAAQTSVNATTVLHQALLKSIRNHEAINQLPTIANSCLTAIAGRASAYSGRKLKLDWIRQRSQEDLLPKTLVFGENPTQALPVPGKFQLR